MPASFSVARVLFVFFSVVASGTSSFGAESPTASSPSQWVEITGNTVVRKLPRAKSEVIADLDRGTLLQVVRRSKNGQWLLVKDDESHSGWIPIKSTHLSSPRPTPTRSQPQEKSPNDLVSSPDKDLPKEAPEDSNDSDLKLVQESSATGLVWRAMLSARYTHRGHLDYPFTFGVGFSKQRWAVQDRRLAESSSWLGAVYKHDWNSAWGLALMGVYGGATAWESGVDLGFMDGSSKSPSQNNKQWRWDFGYSTLYRPSGGPIYWVGRLSLQSRPWEWGASLGLGVAL